MKILVVVDCSPDSGGVFSYMLSICRLIKRSQSDHSFLFAASSYETAVSFREHGIDTIPDIYRPDNPGSLLDIFLSRFGRKKPHVKSKMDMVVDKHGIDLVYFLGHSALAVELKTAPFIFTIWDFCHRDWPEFPEVNTNGVFELREHRYRDVLPRAVAVVVDSDALAEKAVQYYGVRKERIVKIPFLVDINDKAGSENPAVKYGLEQPYIFYPAQFWPHKNHYYILEGMVLLKEKYNIIMNAVFTGNDRGNLPYIIKMADSMGISSQIRYLGFIPREDLFSIYKGSLALVMPTYFGPTNIPPLEALSAGCPLLYSDIPEFRREYDGAAFFMDLDDPGSMAEAVIAILNRDPAVENHKKAAEVLLAGHSEENILPLLEKTFASFDKMLKRWKK